MVSRSCQTYACVFGCSVFSNLFFATSVSSLGDINETCARDSRGLYYLTVSSQIWYLFYMNSIFRTVVRGTILRCGRVSDKWHGDFQCSRQISIPTVKILIVDPGDSYGAHAEAGFTDTDSVS